MSRAYCRKPAPFPELSPSQRGKGRLAIPPALAAQFARDRKAARERQLRRVQERRRRKLIPTLELFGASPPAEWLARVGLAQSELRSAVSAIDAVKRRVNAAHRAGLVTRRAALETHAALMGVQLQLRALIPATICPVCRAEQPDCLTCVGRGALTVREASELPTTLLHEPDPE